MSTVKITQLEIILDDLSPDSRKLENVEWNHPLEPNLVLNFESQSDGKQYSLNLNPNDIESSEPILLPFGTYSLTGKSNSTEAVDYLSFSIEEQVQISNPETNLSIQAKTTSGLFTIPTTSLRAAPLLLDASRNLAEKQGFYYAYSDPKSPIGFELAPKSGTISFRRYWTPDYLLHENLELEYPEGSINNSFQTEGFTFRGITTAIDSDGYPLSLNTRPLAKLPASQNENSGLAISQGRVFSINDGGNNAEIYELNPETGDVIKTIRVINATNTDWEDLAQSETHLFIGDFGNNTGNRTDLNILKIRWTDLLSLSEVEAEKIHFSYEDQIDFSGSNPNHNFDCEGFIYFNGELSLFTKNRGDLRSNHYILPSETGTHVAVKVNGLDVNGLVSAADYDEESQTLVLLGYKLSGISSQCFVWYIRDFQVGDFFGGVARRLDIGSPLSLGQTEGISFLGTRNLLISSERLSSGGFEIPPQFNLLDLKGLY
ncbi:hypothetical protein ACFOSV_11495 [Algoriphagus namhaensis]|uniref:Uncharacterized protein n=1 Tax=Algoriphagus namhaensis TaxID=915353 RepID=A0ABV8AT39_9BACT